MIDRPAPAPAPATTGATGDEPSAELVDVVARYDEDLRWSGTPPSTGRHGAAADTPGDKQALFQCLDFLERAWPRRPDDAVPIAPQRIGKFEIERVLGQGGFGIVYLARDTVLGRTVALKVPRLHTLTSRSLLERFQREARAAAALDHPYIVPLLEAGEDNGLCYIASAYCPGPNLAQWLRKRPNGTSPALAAQIVACLADAVAYSHRCGILHRDIKPGNVMLAPHRAGMADHAGTVASDGPPFSPRLGDFGLAKIRQDATAGILAGDDSAGADALGTPAYMAPEQLERRPDAVGPAVDIYALGAVLYELLVGAPPFQGTSIVDVLDQVRTTDPVPLRRRRSNVPRDLENVCLKCLSKSPLHRYSTAAELRDELQRFLSGRPVAARQPHPWETAARWISRRPSAAALLVTVALSVATTLGSIAWQRATLPRVTAGVQLAVPGTSDTQIATNPASHDATSPSPLTAATTAAMGLIVAPEELPRVGRWRMITRGPRSVVQHDWSLTWSPDSRFIAFGDGTEVRIYAVPSFELVRVLDGHTNSVIAVAWSPDGREIASASADNTIRLWDATTGVPGPVLVGHRARVNAVAWSPNSRQLASGGRDNVVRLWNRDGATVAVLSGHGAEIHAVAWSHGGTKLASGGEGHSIRIWDVASDPMASTEIDVKLRTRSIDWSLDDRQLLASHFYPTELRVWNLDGTQQLALKHDDATVAGEWSPDGTHIVSGSWDNTVRLWSTNGAAGPVLTGHDGDVFCAKWSPDGQWVASGGNDHSVRLWHTDGQPGAVLQGPPYLTDAGWNPDGGRFVVGGGDHAIRICDAEGHQQRVLDVAPRPILSLDWHPGGAGILAGYTDGEIRMWNVDSGRADVLLEASQSGRKEGVRVRWSPDGRRLATAGRHDWDAHILNADGTSAAVLDGHQHMLYGVSWNPLNQRLASVSLDGTMRLWEADGTPGAVCNVGQNVTSVAWRPDGRQLACGCEDGTIQLWEPDGRPGPLLRGHEDRAYSLAWSTDGRWIASGSRDNTVRLWSADGVPLHVLRGHAGAVHSVSWQPHASQLLSAGEDGIVRLWDIATGRPQWTLIILADGQSVRLSPDGRLVSGDPEQIEREFVYVVEQTDGSTRIFTPSEFNAFFRKPD